MNRMVFCPRVRLPVGGSGDDAPDIRDVGVHPAEPFEPASGGVGDHFGKRGFAGARRAVKNYRADPIGLDRAPEQFSFGEDVTLADEFFQRAWPHPCRQRRGGGDRLARRRGGAGWRLLAE